MPRAVSLTWPDGREGIKIVEWVSSVGVSGGRVSGGGLMDVGEK